MKYYMSGSKTSNPMMYNWNTVLVKYCDGSSFAGDIEVKYKVTTFLNYYYYYYYYYYFHIKLNRESLYILKGKIIVMKRFGPY
jgi:hypothetical protein